MQRSGFATSSQLDLFPLEMSTNAALSTCATTTCSATGSAISSPASAAGLSAVALPSGPTTGRSGLDQPRAKAKASPASGSARPIPGISGPRGSRSSSDPGPLSSWESRLRERLARIGSTECALTWKRQATPCGRQLSRLVPSMRLIDATACGLWPTPAATDATGNVESSASKAARGSGGVNLPTAALSLWPTPTAADHKGPNPLDRRPVSHDDLPTRVMRTAMWPTPTAVDGSRGALPPRPWDTGVPLTQRVAMTLWPTPSVASATGGQASRSGDRKDEMLLGGLARSLWATPTHRDHRSILASPETHDRNSRPLLEQVGRVLGAAPSGSPAQTERPGGLAPEFVCWLMGFPVEWLFAAPANHPRPRFQKNIGSAGQARSERSATPSSRRSPPK